ncbi:AKR_HP2_G0030360.mRNA.1.CDS.1 [Saccharomyces cerevisiae]|nr:AKR_HP2_G0030360.mRNA.1.CDS.1 [Saccharomyces cerevisiae]CAI6811872.1 AKR_HP2_G0030360.mRNA.1.CDS.1 [Saccharomyces cerevisiae]
MLISEVAPQTYQGNPGLHVYQLMGTMGIFLGYCTNYGTKKLSQRHSMESALVFALPGLHSWLVE